MQSDLNKNASLGTMQLPPYPGRLDYIFFNPMQEMQFIIINFAKKLS